MQFFIAFLSVFMVVGMFTRSMGWWTYLAIIGAATAVAGVYMTTGAVW